MSDKLDDSQIIDVLKVTYAHVRDDAPLQLLFYLGFDSWLPKDSVSCISDTDKTALVRAKASFRKYVQFFQNDRAYVPNAIKNKQMSEATMRRYTTLLASTLTFGPYVVQKLSSHQVKVNCMLSLPFKQRTDTVQLISEYIRRCFLDAYPQADIQHVKERLLELSKDGNRYVDKFNVQIDKLTKSGP